MGGVILLVIIGFGLIAYGALGASMASSFEVKSAIQETVQVLCYLKSSVQVVGGFMCVAGAFVIEAIMSLKKETKRTNQLLSEFLKRLQ